MERKITGLVGNYGSGKTEIALNLAQKWAKSGRKVRLIDLDIVNPYFRSSEKKEQMKAVGVEVVSPVYANTNVDSPMLSPLVGGSFAIEDTDLLFDVGGDPVGAAALGQYRHKFGQFSGKLYMVVNVHRPFTSSVEQIIAMMEKIQQSCSMDIDGFINNSNLSYESKQRHLLEGRDILRKVSQNTGKPVVMTCGLKENLSGEAWDGEVFALNRYMAPNFEGNQ